MKGKIWLTGWLIILCIGLGIYGGLVYKVDPFMHYHKPDTDRYFYELYNQRSQNNGITKHFEYDALITGTSMTENFKTSEMDDIFGCKSVKVCYSGGTYKELNDNLKVAADCNPDLRIIVRGLDMDMFLDDKDRIREDLGKFPTYLYDANPFNDVNYLFNRDVIWKNVYPMTVANNAEEFKAGITSFDEYSRWQYGYQFGKNAVCPNGIAEADRGEPLHLSEAAKEKIKANADQNITSLARENPDITFYYFFTPYSAVWWRDQVVSGKIYRTIEAEELYIRLILECDNIKLFSFNNRTDIITDLNNYKDDTHYGQWVNSLILRWMHDEKYRLTKENYKAYLADELAYYLNFDYTSLNEQIDHEKDLYAAALLNSELTGVLPVRLSDGVSQGPQPIESDHADDHTYLFFYGKKVEGHGQPTVYVTDDQNEKVGEIFVHDDPDSEWHQYMIDITDVKGPIKIFFEGGHTDITEDPGAEYIFSDITLY